LQNIYKLEFPIFNNDVKDNWFAGAGLGIFIHFGHAASKGWELSWQMTGGVQGQFPLREPVNCDEYFNNAFSFNPSKFDAEIWAKEIFDSGAKYAVFTTKHHDGFAMFDSAFSDYTICKSTTFARDLTKELVDALRKFGIRIGFYFSLPDWYSDKYPRMTDATVTKPYELGSYIRRTSEEWAEFKEYFNNQLTELLSNYGQIDVMWFDGEFEHTEQEWDFAGIRNLVKSLQPNCLINDRCVGHGDFSTPEQHASNVDIDTPWELCLTMNDSWGWTSYDNRWKSVPNILGILLETNIDGGNLLLNVGPNGEGQFPAEASLILSEIGKWVSKNNKALHGVTRINEAISCDFPTAAKEVDGKEIIYIYLKNRPWDFVSLKNVPVNRITNVRVLGVEESITYSAVPFLPEVHKGSIDPRGELEIYLSPETADSLIPVIEISFSKV